MNTEPIAIIGMAGRFPGARDVDELWQNLLNGVESIRSFTDEELAEAGVPPAMTSHPNYVRAGTVVEGADLFDAEFFGFSSREAEILDPQQRVFLECAYTALESAGCDASTFPGRIGVFAGSAISSYLLTNLIKSPKIVETIGQFQTLLANDKDYLATRVSYKLNLRGPSMTVQCACSTSLVAVHLACESLRRGESDACLAGGISLSFPQTAGYIYKPGMISSPDGHCRAFDAAAQGTIFGKGCAIVVLKRLADAVAEGDQIFAVIKGSAINNDGSSKVGYTAPAASGQADVIRRAQEMADFDPSTIGFVEAHGTGTELGDPIETAALSEVFRQKTSGIQFCALGSVKTNIGHLDSAAGVTGLIKCALVLKNQLIPPTLHFKTPNPLIRLETSPFFVNTEVVRWESTSPRRAGVNAFGVGGTNVHVCLEEAPFEARQRSTASYQVFPISAKTDSGLHQVRESLTNQLENSDLAPEDVAFTLQTGRRALAHREFAVGRTAREAVDAFRLRDSKRTGWSVVRSETPDVVFLFPGQGSQQVDMAKHIYEEDVFFRKDVDACCEGLKPHLGYHLRDLLFPESSKADWAIAMLRETVNAQAALFVIEYALANLYMRAGIVPSAMVGHSIGEYVAACLAGVFSLEDALRVVAKRGRLMQSTKPGAMTTVLLPEEECEPFLFNGLAVSVVNAPRMCVVSGESESIAKLEENLRQNKIQTIRLRTSHAFHSRAVDPVLEEFGAFLKTIRLNAPQIPFVSNVTATWITASQATDPGYWVRHMRAPVRFSASLELLLGRSKQVFVEVGTGQSLTSVLRQQTAWTPETVVYSSLPVRPSGSQTVPIHLMTIGKLWCSGAPIKWNALHAGAALRRVSLPAYPFERKRFWVEPEDEKISQSSLSKQRDITDWFYAPSWQRSVSKSEPSGSGEGIWLCFGADTVAARKVGEELRRAGRQIIWIHPDKQTSSFKRLAHDTYSLDCSDAPAYKNLLDSIRSQESDVEGILFCSAFEAAEHDISVEARMKRMEDADELFDHFVYLTQAGKAIRSGRVLQIEVLTSGLREVLGEKISRPERAGIFGVCHAIRAELANTTCRTIDIEDVGVAAPLVVNEILSGPSNETIAYRSGRRWVQTWQKVKLQPSNSDNSCVFKHGGVYLITGGAGGIGLEISQYLARNFSARLILLQRTPLPDRREWDAILASSGEFDSIKAKITRIRELEERGAEVFVAAGDIACQPDVERIWEQARDRFGPIDGVLHAAGIGYLSDLDGLSPSDYKTALAPKVRGTLVLNELIKRDSVELFVLFSSISTVLSSFGYAAYSGANCVLDAFTFSDDVGGNTRVVNMNWDAWLEIGMGAPKPDSAVSTAPRKTSERTEQFKQLVHGHGILPAEGVEAFVRVSNSNLQQTVISTRDLERVLQAESERRLESTQKISRAAAQVQTRPVGADYVPASSNEEAGVIAIWEQLIGVQPIGVTDDFFELGGHSLLGTEVLARIRERFNIQLPMRVIFEATTPSDLAAHIQTVISAPSFSAAAESDEWEELEI